jgi:hypothetical protein
MSKVNWDDKAFVLATVKNRGYALNYASARLRSDVTFCIECAKKKPESIAYFLGEAKKIFQAHHNDIVAVGEAYAQQQAEREQQQQNKANEDLLAKLSTKQKFVNTTNIFKRKLDV